MIVVDAGRKRLLTELLAGLAMVMIALGSIGCGGSSAGTHPAGASSGLGGSRSVAAVPGSRPNAATTSQTTRATPDTDNEGDLTGRDPDDATLFDYGQRASVAEAGAAEAVLKRYYAAAAADDGARVCSLLYSPVAETVVEDYGEPPGPVATRGDTCAEVMTKVYHGQRRLMADHGRALRVTQLRIRGNQGIALLHVGRGPERYIYVRREFGVWKVKVFGDIGIT